MFTTDLSHRVFLTVLLLLIAVIRIGDCEEATATTGAEGNDYNSAISGIEDQMYDEARFYKSSSSPSEDLVLDEIDNDPLEQELEEQQHEQQMSTTESESEGRSSRMNWRQSETSHSTPSSSSSSSSGMETIVSSTSYSVKPGNSASTVILNTKPVSIITTGHNDMENNNNNHGGRKSSGSSSSSSDTFYTKGSSYPHYSSSPPVNFYNKKGEQSTYYDKYNRNNNCFGKKCSPSQDEERLHPDLDEWKTYHSKLNSDIKRNKNYQEYPSGSNYGDEISSGGQYHHQTRYSSLPFTIEPSIPGKKPHYAERYYPLSTRTGHRVSRTTSTTNSPGWVKLQPIFSSAVYDPFAQNNSNNQIISSSKTNEFNDPQLQFSDRLGVELNPESFAERHGWGSHESHKNHGGSRLPGWLEQLNQNTHDFKRPGPTRDEDNKNWVKLDPIPVAGVSISKWVPKGTPSSELPTTNWGIRDKPNTYWDTHQYNNQQQQSHHSDSLNILRPGGGGDGWPSKGSSSYTTRYPDFLNQRYTSVTKQPTPTNAWNDIIYPDGPTSATASWQANKAGLASYPSSFPISHTSTSSSNGGWPSDIRRRPTGSWSAPSSVQSLHHGGSNRRYAVHRPPHNYNYDRTSNPHSYPDLEATSDDPRWVLVSNSRRVAVSPHPITETHRHDPISLFNRNRLPYSQNKNKYSGDSSRYSDYYETGHRLAKDLFKRASSTISTTAASFQDEAFNRVNATLQSLMPVLMHRGSEASTRRPPVLKTITPNPGSSIEDDYSVGDGRATAANITNISTTRKVRKGFGINPVYAAVGAGMIPATMAAVLPMVLGRKKRGVHEDYTLVHFNDLSTATQKFLSNIHIDSKETAVLTKSDSVPFQEKRSLNGKEKYSSYKTVGQNKLPEKLVLR